MEREGSIVSPKSELTPSLEVLWMWKHVNGHDYTITSEPGYLALLLLGLVAMGTKGYQQ